MTPPWAVLSPGFWLSFGAVAAILFVSVGRLQRNHWLKEAVNTQWAVTLGLMPALLRATDSVALLPASYLTRLIRDGRLRELAVPEVDVPLGRLGALYFQGREHPRLARWLASARQALAKAPGQHHRARARSCVQ